MALSYAHGRLTFLTSDTTSTTYVVSGLSFAPVAIKLSWIGIGNTIDAVTETVRKSLGIGFATSTSNRRSCSVTSNDAATSAATGRFVTDIAVLNLVSSIGASVGKIDVQSFDSDGFTLICDGVNAVGNNVTFFWEAWGGSDITVAVCGDITEPAATGNQDYTVTGFVAAATDQIVMLAGCQSTAALDANSDGDSGFYIGFATASDNIVVVGNSDDGSTTMDTDGYCQTGECLAMIVDAGGNPDARATLTQFGTNNFRLNWAARAVTGRRSIFLAIKGGSWKVGSYTIAGNSASATATVSGLSFAPVGVSLIGCMTAQDTAATSHAHDRIGFGFGTSTTDRRSMGVLDEDATANAEINQTLQYDQVLSFPSNAGGLQSAYDINAMNSDGFQIIVDTAGGVASEWQGYLTFGSAASGLTVDCTLGTATSSGFTANVDKQLAIAATLGSATANGLTANINFAKTISATVGTATAEGFTANVDRQLTIAATVGTATASGFLANVDLKRTIVCSVGQAIADGYIASIDFGSGAYTVNCSLGTANASGFIAQVDRQYHVVATLGTASASGFAASIDEQLSINAIIATALADGFNANIDEQLSIGGSIGQAIAGGFLATISGGAIPEYAANGNLYLSIGSDLSIMLGTLGVPSWNTAGRPAGNFKLGYNTDTGKLELYNGATWVGTTFT